MSVVYQKKSQAFPLIFIELIALKIVNRKYLSMLLILFFGSVFDDWIAMKFKKCLNDNQYKQMNDLASEIIESKFIHFF